MKIQKDGIHGPAPVVGVSIGSSGMLTIMCDVVREINEIKASKVSALINMSGGRHMNSHTKLLALLDEVFGPDEKLKSSFRKVSQDYDERTDERVVVIEYRAREKGTLPTTPKGRQQRKARLIQQLYAIASQS